MRLQWVVIYGGCRSLGWRLPIGSTAAEAPKEEHDHPPMGGGGMGGMGGMDM